MTDPDRDLRQMGTPGRARATLAQLKLMTPGPVHITDERVVRLTLFGHTENWIRISGSGDKAVFELDTGG